MASQETDNKAQEEANQFAADSRDLKGFDTSYVKTQVPKGRQKGTATNISRNAADVQGIGASRQFVRLIYDAKRGEVLKPERIDNNYVVAVVTGVYEEGTKTPDVARMEVEPVLRNRKKAEILKQKVGKVTTLEAAAAALGGKLIEVSDSLRMDGTSKMAYEPGVNGATFNPANKGKMVPEVLEGQSGVYIVRVDSVSTTPVLNGDINILRNNMYQQNKQYASNPQSPAYPINSLKKAATIKDKRSNRY